MDLKKINDEFLNASLVKIGDDFVSAVSSLSTVEVEEFMCPECKEWTSSDDPCCGVGPARYNEDSLNGER